MNWRFGASERLLGLAILLTASAMMHAQNPPNGFEWVNQRQDTETIAKVAQALEGTGYTAIREIGVAGGFALVFTIEREHGSLNWDYDFWKVYNVPLRGPGKARAILNGYRLKTYDWITLAAEQPQEFAVSFSDCSECEPAEGFTAFYFRPEDGWHARWRHEKEKAAPGLYYFESGAGEPYSDEIVDQVWAAIANGDKGPITLGTWYHGRDAKTGKITSTAMKYFVDPVTNREQNVELNGAAALDWVRTLCRNQHNPVDFAGGQGSKSCAAILQPAKKL